MARAILRGITVSAGIAIGPCLFLKRHRQNMRHALVPNDRVQEESERLATAIEEAAAGFERARSGLPPELKIQRDILTSQVMICRDRKLGSEAVRRIREHRMNAEWALEECVAQIADTFSRLSSPYIRERIEDVRLVADRIQTRLAGAADALFPKMENGIILAPDLTPADVAGLSKGNMAAFALEQGGPTSHSGILARGLHIPALVGVLNLGEKASQANTAIVDGLSGRLILDPDPAEIAEYRVMRERFAEYEKRVSKGAALPAETEDGERISVLANLENMVEHPDIASCGAEGVGLVRTEFAYLSKPALPEEEELYQEYLGMVRAAGPRKIVFRTFDAGGDKVIGSRKTPPEANPALGLRGIRFCLHHQDVFRTQLRAILRAGAAGNAALLFPMISGQDELKLAKSVLTEVKQELDAEKIPHARDIPLGIMVELPSTVLISDILAREVDFFSIGTNDLIQYSLGADRDNPQVAYLTRTLHPAVVRSIKLVVDNAHSAGIPVCICGEMAADLYNLPLLVGMRVDEISLAPQSIPTAKHLIRKMRASDCRELLHEALSAPSGQTIGNMARLALYNRFPEDSDFFTCLPDADIA
ncbi:MAG: phosphoenolpyruvate--protein phosphotransferase [Desulfovibrio sp.]|jgi:phosphotransferase system enzyme I (PtsI)|nr:phosphoenolpyruvate--protein phosphotransferase [Desulfovibrio sp.]